MGPLRDKTGIYGGNNEGRGGKEEKSSREAKEKSFGALQSSFKKGKKKLKFGNQYKDNWYKKLLNKEFFRKVLIYFIEKIEKKYFLSRVKKLYTGVFFLVFLNILGFKNSNYIFYIHPVCLVQTKTDFILGFEFDLDEILFNKEQAGKEKKQESKLLNQFIQRD